ncbi:DUF4468 domain-containing protein [Hymenobacter sp. HD11105]
MKKIITTALLVILSFIASVSQAQTPAPIEYSERVTVENSHPTALYQQALSWVEGPFSYTPKADLKAQKEAHQIRLTGTSKIKMAAATASGAEQERPLRFDFIFSVTEQGYTYTVGTFRVVPDPKQPAVTVALDEYIQQLSQERTNARTRNDRRVTAQATAVASDVASAFRSYMNSQPVVEDGQIGLPTNDNDGW